MQVRALLNQGSEVSFISESILQLLAVPKQRVEVMFTGIGGCKGETARGITTLVQLVIRLRKLALYEKLSIFLWSDS
jgi:hypothetical protein